MIRENRWPWWLILPLCAGLVFSGAWASRKFFPPKPPPPIYLPGEVVEVEIESIATVQRIASLQRENGNLTLANGVLKDERDRLLEAVETLTATTDPAPPPPEVHIEYPPIFCDDIVPVWYRAELSSTKFKGLGSDGGMRYGWRGRLRCLMAPEGTPADAPGWAVVHDKPFSLSGTVATTSEPPAPRVRPHRWYAGVHASVLRDSTSLFEYDELLQTIDPSALRVYSGVRLFPKARFSVRAGLFLDADAVGVDLGVDW